MEDKPLFRILVTGYGPFRESGENVTQCIINDVFGSWKPDGCKLHSLVIPVLWDAVKKDFLRELEGFRPDLVISLGQADGCGKITVETDYYNIAIGKDNQGLEWQSGIIVRDGSRIYRTSVDIARVMAEIQDRTPFAIHGGIRGMDYLCNFAAYLAARYCRALNKPAKNIFIHVPPPKDLEYEITLRALRALFEEILKNSAIMPIG